MNSGNKKFMAVVSEAEVHPKIVSVYSLVSSESAGITSIASYKSVYQTTCPTFKSVHCNYGKNLNQNISQSSLISPNTIESNTLVNLGLKNLWAPNKPKPKRKIENNSEYNIIEQLKSSNELSCCTPRNKVLRIEPDQESAKKAETVTIASILFNVSFENNSLNPKISYDTFKNKLDSHPKPLVTAFQDKSNPKNISAIESFPLDEMSIDVSRNNSIVEIIESESELDDMEFEDNDDGMEDNKCKIMNSKQNKYFMSVEKKPKDNLSTNTNLKINQEFDAKSMKECKMLVRNKTAKITYKNPFCGHKSCGLHNLPAFSSNDLKNPSLPTQVKTGVPHLNKSNKNEMVNFSNKTLAETTVTINGCAIELETLIDLIIEPFKPLHGLHGNDNIDCAVTPVASVHQLNIKELVNSYLQPSTNKGNAVQKLTSSKGSSPDQLLSIVTLTTLPTSVIKNSKIESKYISPKITNHDVVPIFYSSNTESKMLIRHCIPATYTKATKHTQFPLKVINSLTNSISSSSVQLPANFSKDKTDSSIKIASPGNVTSSSFVSISPKSLNKIMQPESGIIVGSSTSNSVRSSILTISSSNCYSINKTVDISKSYLPKQSSCTLTDNKEHNVKISSYVNGTNLQNEKLCWPLPVTTSIRSTNFSPLVVNSSDNALCTVLTLVVNSSDNALCTNVPSTNKVNVLCSTNFLPSFIETSKSKNQKFFVHTNNSPKISLQSQICMTNYLAPTIATNKSKFSISERFLPMSGVPSASTNNFFLAEYSSSNSSIESSTIPENNFSTAISSSSAMVIVTWATKTNFSTAVQFQYPFKVALPSRKSSIPPLKSILPNISTAVLPNITRDSLPTYVNNAHTKASITSPNEIKFSLPTCISSAVNVILSSKMLSSIPPLRNISFNIKNVTTSSITSASTTITTSIADYGINSGVSKTINSANGNCFLNASVPLCSFKMAPVYSKTYQHSNFLKKCSAVNLKFSQSSNNSPTLIMKSIPATNILLANSQNKILLEASKSDPLVSTIGSSKPAIFSFKDPTFLNKKAPPFIAQINRNNNFSMAKKVSHKISVSSATSKTTVLASTSKTKANSFGPKFVSHNSPGENMPAITNTMKTNSMNFSPVSIGLPIVTNALSYRTSLQNRSIPVTGVAPIQVKTSQNIPIIVSKAPSRSINYLSPAAIISPVITQISNFSLNQNSKFSSTKLSPAFGNFPASLNQTVCLRLGENAYQLMESSNPIVNNLGLCYRLLPVTSLGSVSSINVNILRPIFQNTLYTKKNHSVPISHHDTYLPISVSMDHDNSNVYSKELPVDVNFSLQSSQPQAQPVVTCMSKDSLNTLVSVNSEISNIKSTSYNIKSTSSLTITNSHDVISSSSSALIPFPFNNPASNVTKCILANDEISIDSKATVVLGEREKLFSLIGAKHKKWTFLPNCQETCQTSMFLCLVGLENCVQELCNSFNDNKYLEPPLHASMGFENGFVKSKKRKKFFSFQKKGNLTFIDRKFSKSEKDGTLSVNENLSKKRKNKLENTDAAKQKVSNKKLKVSSINNENFDVCQFKAVSFDHPLEKMQKMINEIKSKTVECQKSNDRKNEATEMSSSFLSNVNENDTNSLQAGLYSPIGIPITSSSCKLAESSSSLNLQQQKLNISEELSIQEQVAILNPLNPSERPFLEHNCKFVRNENTLNTFPVNFKPKLNNQTNRTKLKSLIQGPLEHQKKSLSSKSSLHKTLKKYSSTLTSVDLFPRVVIEKL